MQSCLTFLLSVPKLKQRFSFIVPPAGNVLATLDAAKVSSTILFVASATEGSDSSPRRCIIDDQGKYILNQCFAQGLPTSLVALINLDNIPIKVRSISKFSMTMKIAIWLK